jgi:hypothetical protein
LPLFLYIGFIYVDIGPLNEEINFSITQEKILRCIKKLTNNKACGEDYAVNEYIKSTSDLFLPTYEKIFNARHKRSVSKFSCCTRSSSGVLFRFLKSLNKSPKGMLGCFLSLPLFKSFQYPFGSDVFNIFLFCFALKQDVAEVEKRYKKTLDKHSKIYRADMRKKIKKLKTSDPKEYLKIALNIFS